VHFIQPNISSRIVRSVGIRLRSTTQPTINVVLHKGNFRAYSAAQLILPNGQFAEIARKEDVTRRRIEIRFTRLGEVREVR
jgi:hypothetical protein